MSYSWSHVAPSVDRVQNLAGTKNKIELKEE